MVLEILSSEGCTVVLLLVYLLCYLGRISPFTKTWELAHGMANDRLLQVNHISGVVLQCLHGCVGPVVHLIVRWLTPSSVGTAMADGTCVV